MKPLVKALKVSPSQIENESAQEFKLSLSFGLKLSCTLNDFGRLPCALMNLKLLKIFLESFREFDLVWPEVMIVDES